MGKRENLKRLRVKHAGKQPFLKPDFIDAQQWLIFSAYCHGGLTAGEIGKKAGISASRVRSLVHDVDAQLDPATPARPGSKPITLDSRVDDLILSSRARNALGSLGCNSIQDVLRLDLSGSHGIGRKTRDEVMAALRRSGLRHPKLDKVLNPEIQRIDRSLERIHGRINAALGTVSKEIAALQKRLRKQMDVPNGEREGGGAPALACICSDTQESEKEAQ